MSVLSRTHVSGAKSASTGPDRLSVWPLRDRGKSLIFAYRFDTSPMIRILRWNLFLSFIT
jgi:hypothetical protein